MTDTKDQPIELNDSALQDAQGGLLPAVKTNIGDVAGIVDGTSNVVNPNANLHARKAGGHQTD